MIFEAKRQISLSEFDRGQAMIHKYKLKTKRKKP